MPDHEAHAEAANVGTSVPVDAQAQDRALQKARATVDFLERQIATTEASVEKLGQKADQAKAEASAAREAQGEARDRIGGLKDRLSEAKTYLAGMES